ncbi:MAG: tRNA (adenosine(37)-N6)-dimethylallyltransferase MiaA [Clostridiaceae bacterium]|nr:tRNA (adenosine(37)-N6)-dimethylallyltransferase MiaA [Clostridiaceae bacterium]
MRYLEGAPIPIIIGPTGSGKTALALDLAELLDSAIVSSDSMQLYRGLDIATAKATSEEQRRAPHYLVDILDPADVFSVNDYINAAENCLQELTGRGVWPIVVGGTPQYVTALVEGIRFAPESLDGELRARLQARIAQEGGNVLLAELAELDPARAAKLHPNDHRRIVRALEILRTSGQKQSEWDTEASRRALPWKFEVYAIDLPREELYRRIDLRVDRMLEAGLLDEARYVWRLDLPPKASCLQAIGYKELFAYFNGVMTLEEATELLKRNSRRYAKRQLTWFRGKEWITWLNPEELADFPARLALKLTKF